MRLWPDTLAGRTLALLFGMTLLLVVVSAMLLYDERHQRFVERNRHYLLERITVLSRLVNDADPEQRQRIIKRAAQRGDRVSLADRPDVERQSQHPLERKLVRSLRRNLDLPDPDSVRVRVKFEERRGDEARNEPRRDRHNRFGEFGGMDISIRLWDQRWLNLSVDKPAGAPPWAGGMLQLMALLLVLFTVVALISARRLARPMGLLAEAADRFGLGQPQSPLPERGPREVRNTIRAFNRMQRRLQKHIEDRSRMLAAVSHDLRTPITTLRLRAEYIEDDEMRERTLTTLGEMETILSATLGFARDEAADEAARSTDLAALLSSLVDDHCDLGGVIEYQGPDKLAFLCRPVALRRALNNLIDNGLKYGGAVWVGLSAVDAGVEIRIDDQGPGIPKEKLEDVFTPFYRLENSRNRETGGIGLGLAVAQTIVHAHGGQLSLRNRPEGGLRALLRLPSH